MKKVEKKQAEKKVKKIQTKEKTENWQEKYLEIEIKYKRSLADYSNLLKRAEKERQEFAKYANEQLIIEMLPIYDHLKMSVQYADKEVKTNGWLQGIECVIKQFKDFLQNQGIEEIETVGCKFDHETMEAIKGQGNKVIKQIKAGYKLKEKVIVPAQVILDNN